MTVDTESPVAQYTIAGVGPYTLPWPYQEGRIEVAVAQGNVWAVLDPADYTVTPASSASDGDIEISIAAATAYAGQTLHLTRTTLDEQGWVGQSSTREKGIEDQLDQMVMMAQDLKAQTNRSLRVRGASIPPAVVEDGRAVIYDATLGFIPGPNGADIAAAEANAAIAAAAALQAQIYNQGPVFATHHALMADAVLSYSTGVNRVAVAPGMVVRTLQKGFTYVVQDPAAPFYDWATPGGVKFSHVDGPYVIVIAGQSLAAGARAGGPNPASPLVKVYDAVTGTLGSSDYTALPLSRTNPDGNEGNNNYAVARAHRITDDTGRLVVIAFDCQGGTSIDAWVASGIASTRYAALRTKVAALLALVGRTNVDEILWGQGEADFQDLFSTHLDNLTLLRNQWRAETWCDYQTPIYMMGPSKLHDRYFWQSAMKHFCSSVDSRCVFVPANGLRTDYDTIGAGTPIPGTGDFTHFSGESTWEAGYYHIADAAPIEAPAELFHGRSTGPANPGDPTVVATFSSLFSFGSRTAGGGLAEAFSGTGAATAFTLLRRGTIIDTVTVGGVEKVTPGDWTLAGQVITFAVAPPAGADNIVITYGAPINAPGATGVLGWGEAIYIDGNYNAGFGFDIYIANLNSYNVAGGRGHQVIDAANYGAIFGFQSILKAPYTVAGGRGHVLADDGGTALGQFSKYITAQADPVLLQLGNGSSAGARSNAIAVRKSGITEHAVLTVATLGPAGQDGRRGFVGDATATTFASVVVGGGANKVPVYDDGTNWRIG